MTKRKRTTQARRAPDAQPTASSTAMADAVDAGSADGPTAAAVGPSGAPPNRWRRWAAELGIPFGAFVVIEWALAALIGVLVIGAVLRGTAPAAPAAAPPFAKADEPITDAAAHADSPARPVGGAWFDILGGGAAGANPFGSDTSNGAADAASTASGSSIATIAGTTGSAVSAGQPAATGASPAGASGAPSGSVRFRVGPGDQFARPGDDDGPRRTAARRDPRHGAEHHRRPGRPAGERDAAAGDGHPDHSRLHDASDDASDRDDKPGRGDADDEAARRNHPHDGAVDDAAGSDDPTTAADARRLLRPRPAPRR